MTDLKTGILLWSQAATWPEMLDAARRSIDWATTIYGPGTTCTGSSATRTSRSSRAGPHLAAWAMATDQTRLGLLVGANTFRNPGLTAKTAETLDHISDGRAILGIGGAWMEPEHTAHGIEFGTGFGERLDWLDEAVGAMRAVLDQSATSEPGAHYAFDDLRHQPLPIQKRLPIMIGGSGEKKTLRTVAKYADMWNAMGTLELMTHKVEVLRGHCDAVGREIGEIEFTLGVKLTIRDSEAEADRVWKAAMEHNRTPIADVADDNTFWNGLPSRSPTASAPTSSSASTPSSRSSRRPTTSRRSSASSARSSRSSTRGSGGSARPQRSWLWREALPGCDRRLDSRSARRWPRRPTTNLRRNCCHERLGSGELGRSPAVLPSGDQV